jgi:acyl-coenzyme A thioesterase PaaI-like protein
MTVTAAPAHPRPFGEVTAVFPGEPGRFDARVDPEWTIAGKPNGGYLLAMLGRAAASMTAHHHVITASAQYLRVPDPGPVVIEAEVGRTGRSASQVRARLVQDSRVCVEALLTTAHLDGPARTFWDRGLPERSPTRPEECARLIPKLPNGMRVPIMEQIEVRLEPATAGFTRGEPSGRGELRGWLSLPGGEAFDSTSLVFALDAFPPATFDIEFSGWVPTLELTAYVRARPAPGPVQVLQRAQLVAAGRVDEACFVWDRAGRLVAHGTQLAGIRLG